jgi:hypothetical protein
MSTIINATTTNGVVIQPDNSGSLELQTNSGTTAVTIDTSQNVGIGTGAPTAKLGITAGTLGTTAGNQVAYQTLISNSGNNDVFEITNTRTSAGSDWTTAGTRLQQKIDITYMGYIQFNGGGNDAGMSFGTGLSASATGIAERMRITSGGEVYVAGTTDRGAFNLQCNGTGVWGAGAYTNGSDERIKENITTLDTGLDVVAKLNPVTYTYKEDWSRDQSIQTGFIAQDLLVALEGKNYVDGIVNQSSEYMSVAYQNIIPILTKAIQEQQTIINDLKARVETLEAKLG